LPRAIATLDPGYFAFVMATGIVSIGTHLLGYALLSEVILGFAVAGFVGLLAAYLARFVFFQPFVRQSAADPTVAMAYFTVVAGTDVVATRFVLAGHPLVAFGLGCGAALIWVVLTYGLPGSIVAAARRPVLREINGTWLVWVVSTQSLSIVATAVASHAPTEWLHNALPIVAVSLWGLGVMLYLVLIVIIFLRLLVVEVTPAEMGPAYWIAMGATAISVRAAAGILTLHDPGARLLVAALRPFVVGLSVVLWAFGTWWIPLLVLFGVWRYVLRRYPRNREPRSASSTTRRTRALRHLPAARSPWHLPAARSPCVTSTRATTHSEKAYRPTLPSGPRLAGRSQQTRARTSPTLAPRRPRSSDVR